MAGAVVVGVVDRRAPGQSPVEVVHRRLGDGDRPVGDHRGEHVGGRVVVAGVVLVRGIGRWTAEMFLMFQLGRLDVWPVGDLGVRKGYAVIHGRPAMPTAKELEGLGDPLRPYRSLAAWYCWRAVDTQGGRSE